jgi:predicted enzyme related to lactoylglutathione lyase
MANSQLNAKLVMCNVPTKNSVAARKFYDMLLGGEDFARSLDDKLESYFRPISQEGLTLTIATRHDAREPVTCFFAVDNLDETVRQLTAAGGKVIVSPYEMPPSAPPQAIAAAQRVHRSGNMGRFVTMLDPDENYIGLIQLDDSMQSHFNARPAQRTLSKAQVDLHDQWKQQGESQMR